VQSYSLAANSSATLAVNLTNGIVTITMDLAGQLLTATGATGAPVSFGSHTGSGTINTASSTIDGSFTATSGPQSANNFAGWFFGPQGAEAGLTFSMTASDTTKRTRIVGNIIAIRQ
jgi:hypothetical protein